MKKLIVNIAGVPTKLDYKLVLLNKLILDQDNPRIGLFKEGNTRALIYKQLNEDFPNKVEYQKIPGYVLPPKINKEKIEFIRLQAHLRGVTPWDSYERARYLYLLWD